MKDKEKINKFLDLARKLKKPVECEGDSDTNYSRSPWNGL